MADSHTTEYVCGTCGEPRLGLPAFSTHAIRQHDYRDLPAAVADCAEIRHVRTDSGIDY